MHYSTLVDVATVAAQIKHPDWVILDCRFELTDPTWGETQFAAGHLPGAQYAHLDRDLAAPPTATSGRHPLPDPEVFAAKAREWGVHSGTQVVVHDQAGGVFAARAWWLFRWLGHPRVALLDGGYAAWCAAGQAVSTETLARPIGNFVPHPDSTQVANVDDVVAALGHSTMHLVDARGADRFAGENESMDARAGHVPGAVNHPFATNLTAGRLQAPDTLRERWLATLDGRDPKEMVAMCGSGVSACHNLLAMELAGLPGARLYPGSWSEWIKDPKRPIAK
ncbi:MAG: sulfurtransferase [Steroidobacteraceae bacterium]|nr:sulfurtransferase [Gammaproteobacteria bacterium]